MFLFILIAIFAGIAPMMVYALIVWWFDRYEKEPWPLLAGMFIWGAFPAILLALFVELVLDIPIKALIQPGLTYDLLGSSFIAPAVEEFSKGLAVLAIFALFYRHFDDVLDGVVSGSIVGFGFAAVENVLYFLMALSKGGVGALPGMIFLRAFLFGLNHALFTSFTGIGLALARLSRGGLKVALPMLGFALAIGAHALHNAGAAFASLTPFSLVFSALSDWAGIAIILVIILLATLQERGWIVQYLADEVTSGLITPQQYRAACSYLERVTQQVNALFSGHLVRYWRLGRLYQLMTLLAFRKYQLATFGDEGGNRAEIERRRAEIVAMQGNT